MLMTRININEKQAEAWKVGESTELEKWIDFGFYKTEFILKNKVLTIKYDDKEIAEFEDALEECLDEELFDKMCDRFFKLIELSKTEDHFKISVQCMPILTIFDEISKHTEWATEPMLRRLHRVRQTTHEFAYGLHSQSD